MFTSMFAMFTARLNKVRSNEKFKI